MRTSQYSLTAALLALAPAVASAQVTCQITGPTVVSGYAADACQKSVDVFAFVVPQFAQALSGGGAILGTANTLGGLGKFSLNVRATAVEGRVPDIDAISLSAAGAQASQMATLKQYVPAPVVDVGVGILPGFKVGKTKVFSLDGVANVAYLPDVDANELKLVVPGGKRLKFGYGGRLGLTRDGNFVPAISASYIRRELPTADITADFQGGTGGTNQLSLTGFGISTEAIRVSISKRVGFIEIGGGGGRDTYTTALEIGATASNGVNTASASYSMTQKLTRDVVYVSAAINLPLLKIAAEAGQAMGGTSIATYNTFVDGGQNDSRRFASAGIRLSF